MFNKGSKFIYFSLVASLLVFFTLSAQAIETTVDTSDNIQDSITELEDNDNLLALQQTETEIKEICYIGNTDQIHCSLDDQDLCDQMIESKQSTNSIERCENVEVAKALKSIATKKITDEIEKVREASRKLTEDYFENLEGFGAFGDEEITPDALSAMTSAGDAVAAQADDSQSKESLMELFNKLLAQNSLPQALTGSPSQGYNSNFASLLNGVNGSNLGITGDGNIARVAETIRLSTRNVPGTNGGKLGCAWALNEVVRIATGHPITEGGKLSTSSTYQALINSPQRFREVDKNSPVTGKVCVTPKSSAGYGHAWAQGTSGHYFSNSSSQAAWRREGPNPGGKFNRSRCFVNVA